MKNEDCRVKNAEWRRPDELIPQNIAVWSGMVGITRDYSGLVRNGRAKGNEENRKQKAENRAAKMQSAEFPPPTPGFKRTSV